ncbi:PEP-CTERM sorting domain-containing protein [Chamaesiphon minutus]|uniref:PEP-CTERM putative exosortase interaction domain-containing protein n=1 Tax=Chamaesiphon minutus (strain ATCC 27169 / PCC 6605) TaxID=1173020 RepID=K9UP94_CHAP6|nr:PEP-CTERM sorting domain-containing protein [Chamaesiphon minutus]AFY96640.1 PEP-CTERM putative exosortase interaction domain-containing protein [Chamaesiphon minutus PCC 6605]
MYEIKKGCAQAVAGAVTTAALYAIAAPAPAAAASFTLDNSNNNSGTFNYTGRLDTVTITTTGVYTIDAFGGQGGNSGNNNSPLKGGELKADFNLTQGEVLTIIVGGMGGMGTPGAFGSFGAGGGGGGTFVTTILNGMPTILLSAGGGDSVPGFFGPGGFGGGSGGNGGNNGLGGFVIDIPPVGTFSGAVLGIGGDGGFGGGGGGSGGIGGIGGSGIGIVNGNIALVTGNNGIGTSGSGGIGGRGGSSFGIYNQSAIAGSIVSNHVIRSGNGLLSITYNAPATAVPEPFTIVGTLIGGTAAFRMRKKLKTTHK